MRKALLVGIDEYLQCPLHGCCNDAEAIKKLLSKNENNTPNFSVKMENNVKTKGRLKQLIKECFAGDSDVALFYYSGHGYVDSTGGYLVTPDYSEEDCGVSLQDVLAIANASSCKDKIVVLDSCYSGTLGNIAVMNQKTSIIGEGVTILTASRSSETSMEINGHGVFTALLIEALKGGAADAVGHISLGGIYAYIDKALGPWEQRPVFKTNVTRFTSLRDVVPQVDIEIIHRICKYFENEESNYQLDPSYEPTNSPEDDHQIIEPYAQNDHTKIFADLQKLEGVGMVKPVGTEHMYFAAMESKKCKLTSIGKQYWRLVKNELI